MIQQCPDESEQRLVRDLTPEMLARENNVVRFFHMIANTPGFQTRLEAWKAQLEFADRRLQIMEKVSLFDNFCQSVKESKKFAKSLKIIVVLGNNLNNLDESRGAKGMRVEDLLQMTNVKTQMKATFLDWTVSYLHKVDPELSEFTEDLRLVDEASRVDLAALEGDVRELQSGMKTVEGVLKDQQSDERVREVMGQHHDFAEPLLRELEKRYAVMKETVVELMRYMGEGSNAKLSKATEWLSGLADFLNQYRQSHEKMMKKVAKKEEKQKSPQPKKQHSQKHLFAGFQGPPAIPKEGGSAPVVNRKPSPSFVSGAGPGAGGPAGPPRTNSEMKRKEDQKNALMDLL
eukprot:Rhum_TRINITY_DN14246_c11_g1::Rhum_TRINITY_DN14246_c11_g1_i1::g.75780::m.75780